MPKSAPATEDAVTSAAATTTMMPGAELLLKALEDEGVEVVFGYPGGAVLPIYDALFKNRRRFMPQKAMPVQLARPVLFLSHRVPELPTPLPA